MKKAIITLAIISAYVLIVGGVCGKRSKTVFIDPPETTEAMSVEESIAAGHMAWCVAQQSSKSDKQTLSCRITFYTPYSDGGRWGYQTATGAKSEHLKTCAVDPEVIPLGSEIEVNGLTLTAVDTGSAVKGNVVDVFFDGTNAEARDWIAAFGDFMEVKVKL